MSWNYYKNDLEQLLATFLIIKMDNYPLPNVIQALIEDIWNQNLFDKKLLIA